MGILNVVLQGAKATGLGVARLGVMGAIYTGQNELTNINRQMSKGFNEGIKKGFDFEAEPIFKGRLLKSDAPVAKVPTTVWQKVWNGTKKAGNTVGRMILMGGVYTATSQLNDMNRGLSKDFNGRISRTYSFSIKPRIQNGLGMDK